MTIYLPKTGDEAICQACRDSVGGNLDGRRASGQTLGGTQVGILHVGGGEFSWYPVPEVLVASGLHATGPGHSFG